MKMRKGFRITRIYWAFLLPQCSFSFSFTNIEHPHFPFGWNHYKRKTWKRKNKWNANQSPESEFMCELKTTKSGTWRTFFFSFSFFSRKLGIENELKIKWEILISSTIFFCSFFRMVFGATVGFVCQYFMLTAVELAFKQSNFPQNCHDVQIDIETFDMNYTKWQNNR